MPIEPDTVETPMPAPHCPYCNGEMPGVGMFNWPSKSWVILCVYCMHCLRALHFSTIPLAIAEEPSRLSIPS
jgi:glutaredoxin